MNAIQKWKILILPCKNGPLLLFIFFLSFVLNLRHNFRWQKPASCRWVVTWRPALAVTKCRAKVPERKPPPDSRPTPPIRSHKSKRHTFNDRLLHLVTHVPSDSPCAHAEVRVLYLEFHHPQRGRRRRTGETEIETSWLCVWVRVAVSKVLCYVRHSWAGLCHAMLVSAKHPDPPDSNTRSTVPTIPLVRDTKCTRKQELSHNHILGIRFYFSVVLMSKCMPRICTAISKRK